MWSRHPRVGDRLTVLARSTSVGGEDGFQAPPAQRGTQRLLDAAPGALVAADADDDASTRRWFTRWDSRARRAALVLLAPLALIVVWWWWSGQPEPVRSPETVIAGDGIDPTLDLEEVSGNVLVHVVGTVAQPGVVELPIGSRVRDAIEAAGGATKNKALESVNLARQVVDGEQIVVGVVVDGGSSPVISLNSSDTDRLQELPGVGPVIAQRIVQWRQENGPFRSVDELTEVSGIGPSMVEQIRDLVSM